MKVILAHQNLGFKGGCVTHETPPATQTGQFEGTFTGPEEEERAERERNKARNGATR
jgi:hypothetical protein